MTSTILLIDAENIDFEVDEHTQVLNLYLDHKV